MRRSYYMKKGFILSKKQIIIPDLIICNSLTIKIVFLSKMYEIGNYKCTYIIRLWFWVNKLILRNEVEMLPDSEAEGFQRLKWIECDVRSLKVESDHQLRDLHRSVSTKRDRGPNLRPSEPLGILNRCTSRCRCDFEQSYEHSLIQHKAQILIFPNIYGNKWMFFDENVWNEYLDFFAIIFFIKCHLMERLYDFFIKLCII